MGEREETLNVRVGARLQTTRPSVPEANDEACEERVSGERPSFVPRSETPTVDDSLPPPPPVLRSHSTATARVTSPGRYAIVAPRASRREKW